ncbi:MAG: sulfite exporter TauE/SafE family protein [Verrucomicrobia bacterium]|nr:sulfite exporter TauE/SafE family protein [Verrucomicrobiota bacterium]
MDEFLILLFLFAIGLVTGAIGSISGGVIMMAAPILASFNMPLANAIATARIASIGSITGGLIQFHQAGKVKYTLAAEMMLWSILGAVIGAHMLFSVPETDLGIYVGLLMLFLLCFGFVKDRISIPKTWSLPLRHTLGRFLFFLSGIIGGFLGGQGIISSFLLMHVFQLSPSESIGTRKAISMAVAFTAMFIYALWGEIYLVYGLAMFFGSFLGATFSSKWILQRQESTVMLILNIVIIILAIKLLFFT